MLKLEFVELLVLREEDHHRGGWRSRRLTWLGGKLVRLHPPRPRAALRDLAKVAGELLGEVKQDVPWLKLERFW